MERILLQKYELIREIGAGGSGRVHLAMDKHLSRLVAIKESGETVPIAEAALLKELKHPGLPEIYDYFKEQGSNWLVMEYIEGMSLRQYLDRHGKVNEQQAVKWALELCGILTYLHGRHPSVIYRDLKPENIMIGQDGRLRLIDLGAAVYSICGRENLPVCAGTIGYCPSRQWKGARADASWDIYGLGAVLHEMLTGKNPARPPYERRSLREYDKSLTGSMDKIIENCTDAKETCRFQSMEQVEEALFSYRKKGWLAVLWKQFKMLIMAILSLGTAGCFFFPLLVGLPEDQFPFPYLEKPLFFLMITLLLYFLFYKIPRKRNFLRKQEKNIWLTQKQFSGLFSIILFLCAQILAVGFFSMTIPAVHADDEMGKLWVEMRDDQGRKMLLKEDALYITDDCIRFELPADRLPKEEISLQMVAVGQEGEVYSSRIFHIRAQEDLN